jgi:hypothetical protein
MPNDREFDLTDPLRRSHSYNCLHDQHLQVYFRSNDIRKRMVDEGNGDVCLINVLFSPRQFLKLLRNLAWELRSESLHESWWELRSESLHESWEARVCMRVEKREFAWELRSESLHESWEARVCMRVFSTLVPQSNEDKRFMKVDAGAKLEGGGGGTPPENTNHLDWQGESSGLAG